VQDPVILVVVVDWGRWIAQEVQKAMIQFLRSIDQEVEIRRAKEDYLLERRRILVWDWGWRVIRSNNRVPLILRSRCSS
jgi:hypothetical protein